MGRHTLRMQEARRRAGDRCQRCHRSGSGSLLEFDHRDPATKIRALADMTNASDESFWAEWAKCDLLCRPCHRTKTTEAGEWTRVGPGVVVEGVNHGTRTGYYKHGCRCGECRRWNRERKQRT